LSRTREVEVEKETIQAANSADQQSSTEPRFGDLGRVAAGERKSVILPGERPLTGGSSRIRAAGAHEGVVASELQDNLACARYMLPAKRLIAT
jgi:hypothetical protein